MKVKKNKNQHSAIAPALLYLLHPCSRRMMQIKTDLRGFFYSFICDNPLHPCYPCAISFQR